MASVDDVQKLAALSRLAIPEESLPRLAKEFEGIVSYISQLSTLTIAARDGKKPALRNVFRADGEPHAPGRYTEKLAEQFPAREGDALSVQQIISHD